MTVLIIVIVVVVEAVVVVEPSVPHVDERALDAGDDIRVHAPRLFDADHAIEIPGNAPFAGSAHHRPRDDGPAQLFWHRIGLGRKVIGGTALGMMMQVRTVGPLAKVGIPCGAKDHAVPGLIDGVGRHADHLVVAQCRGATPQPLPQARHNELARLPRAGLEHGRRQLEGRDCGVRPLQFPSARASHDSTVGAARRFGVAYDQNKIRFLGED